MKKTPNIQKQFKRTLREMSQAELRKRAASDAEKRATEAAQRGIQLVKAGNIPAAKKAELEAKRWLKVVQRYRGGLT